MLEDNLPAENNDLEIQDVALTENDQDNLALKVEKE